MDQPEVVAGIVEGRSERQIIVVSAAAGITKKLRNYSVLATNTEDDTPEIKAIRDEIVERYDERYKSLGDKTRGALRDYGANLLMPGKPNPNFYISVGERLSAKYGGHLFEARSMAPAVIFGPDGKVDYPATMSAIQIQVHNSREKRLAIPGFYGFDDNLRIHLLDEGGSDRTGSLYGRATGWDYENWTDQPGIRSADPRIIAHAPTIGELTWREIREGANSGSKVLQGDSISDLGDSDITVTVRDTFKPDGLFTYAHKDSSRFREREIDLRHPVVAVSGRDDLAVINIDDLGMANSLGYSEGIFKRMRQLGLSLANYPTLEDYASITLHRTDNNAEAILELADYIRQNLITGGSDNVTIENMGVVSLIGEALHDRRTNAQAVARGIGSAAVHDITVTSIPGLQGPSTSFLVTHRPEDDLAEDKRPEDYVTTVNRLVRILHAYEVEGKSLLSGRKLA